MACDMFLKVGFGKMPALGLGTWQSSGDSLEEALDTALEIGYRHIDTSEAYNNEEIIGRVLKRWFDEGKLKRQDVFITTKLSATSMYPEKVEDRLNESLRKLQLDYVDLYLISSPITMVKDGRDIYGNLNIDYIDIWEKMESSCFRPAKNIGVSNFTVEQIERLLKVCRIKPAINQIEMHIFLQQKNLVDFCIKHEIAIGAYAPLGSRGYNAYLASLSKYSTKLPDMLNNKVVKEIAGKHTKSSAQVLLRFLLQLGVAPMPKSVTPERLSENFDVFDFSLDENDMTKLRGLDVGDEARVYDWKMFGR